MSISYMLSVFIVLRYFCRLALGPDLRCSHGNGGQCLFLSLVSSSSFTLSSLPLSYVAYCLFIHYSAITTRSTPYKDQSNSKIPLVVRQFKIVDSASSHGLQQQEQPIRVDAISDCVLVDELTRITTMHPFLEVIMEIRRAIVRNIG